MAGIRSARKYGYSSARANAMKSKLLDRKTMFEIANAKDMGAIISMLYEREYRREIEEFGGLKIKADLLDFALSKNLARNLLSLSRLPTGREKTIMQGITGKWDLYNIRLAIEAKGKRQGFESIARYILDVGRYNALAIKEAMREDSVEGMLSKLMLNSPYRKILSASLESFKKTRSTFDAVSTLDKEYYAYLSRLAIELWKIEVSSSARMLRMEIDTKNILTLIRAKRLEMKQAAIGPLLISGGNLGVAYLEQLYANSKDITEIASQIKLFDLHEAVELFKKDPHRQLLTFEIGIRNSMLSKGIRSLGHKILSFGTMLAYLYMKETEISTLRILINGKAYGLEESDIKRLIGWKQN